MATPSKPPKLKRITKGDFSEVEEVFKAAAYLIVPEDQTQHQAFLKLMPYLYVLKNKGCSFGQLTTLLTECNFNLQPSTVKDYYNNALATRMDIFQERMNEQILLLAEVRKVTKGAEVSDMAEQAMAIMARQKTAAASKIDKLFGGGSSATPVAQTSSAGSNEAAKPLLAENKNSGLRSAPVISPSESKSQNIDSPAIALRCLALKDGVEPLKQRPNTPSEAYLPGDLEHPKIAGLMLSLDERIYSACLEYVDENGEVKLETLDEKRFRILWKRPIPMTKTMTGDSFTKMNFNSFKKANT